MTNNEKAIMYAVARGNLEALLLQALNAEPRGALQIILFLNEKIGVLFSPGSVYPKLWKLEKEGCVKQNEEKKFELTEAGRHRLKQNVTSLLLIWKFLGETLK